MYFFTADEHYGHKNIIKFCSRPFDSVDEMDEAMINRHNELVGLDDITVHIGDFTLKKNRKWIETVLIKRLNGKHIFLLGSHDYWLEKPFVEIDTGPVRDIWQKEIDLIDGEKVYLVACHYAMRTWPRSYHGSYQLYGHSHGVLPPIGKQIDVGVDTNNFYPYSLDTLIQQIRIRNFT